MNIILFEPQIPQNTGNIIRTCSVTGCSLTLVKPLGFSLTDKTLKRAGLDYFHEVEINVIDDLETFLEQTENDFYFFSSKVKKGYHEVSYDKNTHLIFGSETKGLPSSYFKKWKKKFVTFPMKENKRCLNLSNAAAIAIYEAYRQQDFIF